MFLRVTVVLLVAATLASSAGARSERSLTIKLKSVQTGARAIDKTPKQMAAGKFSPGDILVIRDNLFNRVAQLGRPAGVKVGADRSVLTFVSGTAANLVGSASLPGSVVTSRDASIRGDGHPVYENHGRVRQVRGRSWNRDGTCFGLRSQERDEHLSLGPSVARGRASNRQ